MSEESKKWYRMTRPLFNSGYEDDEFWAFGRDGFQEQLDTAIGSDVLIYDKRIYVEPQKVRVIIQQKTSDVYNSTVNRQILSNIGILKCGQYVKYDGGIWMVSSFPDNNRIYEKAVLWKCKHSIHFISPLTGKIVEYPVFSENSTQYGTGEAEKTNINVGEDQHLIYIPYNEETIMLDDRFRFLMDKNLGHPTAYRITRVDPVSYAVGDEFWNDGLIQWAVLEDQFNTASDNAELMVADYYPKDDSGSEETPGSDVGMVIRDTDGDFKLAIGETKKIQVQFTDTWGRHLQPLSYRLEYDFGDAAVVESDQDGVIVIRASESAEYVGRYIEMRVVSDEYGCEATIKILIVNW